MDITEIIGKGKAFEPPFSVSLGCRIYDNNLRLVLEPEFPHYLQYFKSSAEAADVAITLANHIVELLNERWKDETMRP